MKKTLAIVLAIVMILACGSAFARTGWENGNDTKTYKNFKVELKAYEARDNGAGLSLADYKAGSAADEITGRVVIGTAVVIKVKVTIPKQENTDLNKFDYVNAKLNMTFGNLDVTGTAASLAGAAPNFYAAPAAGQGFLACLGNGTTTLLTATTDYKEVTADEEYNLFINVDDAKAAADQKAVEYTVFVVGQAKKTAECPITATFTMGQDVDGTSKFVAFNVGDDKFVAYFSDAVDKPDTLDDLKVAVTGGHKWFVVAKVADNTVAALTGLTAESGLVFDVNSSNKLSNMRLISALNGTTAGVSYAVDSCGTDNGIKFVDAGNDVCACNGKEIVTAAMEKELNKLLGALGFDYNRGDADYGFATSKNVNGLANQVKVAAGYTFNECTELAVVDIPQTGSFAYGFAVVAMAIVAGAVVAIRKIRA